MKALRKPLAASGLLRQLERSSDQRAAHWLRSQFAIHDFEDLASLDAPWWSYRSIDYVEGWLAARPRPVRVFEWGAGASTMWLASRVDELRSIEHDLGFADMVRPLIPSHVHLSAIAPTPSANPVVASLKRGHANLDFTDYVDAIDTTSGPFDLISIDGRARVECLLRALERLKPDGIVVFDNTGRKEYQQAMEALDVDVIHLSGWAPALPYPSKTSIVTPRRV